MNSRVNLSPRSPVGSPVTPLLRAVLLADLVDSTAFIESFGDARAAVGLQRLDLRIRDLLEFTGGRLIDKADGLLAIFERPIQAVDFALRYQQALREFSSSEGATLLARVGIHVGEVMTWSNADRDILAGAKPLEVEGLAKPVAARLMALAFPGQILISSMAQSLAQRAQPELGERAERLRWAAHGRYRFKGVPAPILVHEVGEVGIAPLRRPGSSPKAWREVPIWRRPPVLAVEAVLFVAALAFYGYTLSKSPPALAFQQREWVVVGDLSNFTEDPRLDDSLDTALRISLEQSRYVNVIPDLKVRDALQRMGRSQKAAVDRAVGSEIALREGARALLLPSVAEVGGRLRVSIEVVDPNNQATVFAQSAEGRGLGSALGSLDQATADLREALGESMGNIRSEDKPLAQVTTSNLDALRAYSLGNAAYLKSRDADALALYQQALALDPRFAMAQVGMARIRARNGELAQAKQLALQASDNRARLSQREAMELDTFIARFGPPAQAMSKFKVWASMYPDSFRAYYGYSLAAFENNEYRSGLRFLAPALAPKNPAQASAYYLQGMLLLALERYPEARVAFQRADSLGVAGDKLEGAELFAAQRDFAGARRALRSQTGSGMSASQAYQHSDDPVFLLDQGKWQEARSSLASLQAQVDRAFPSLASALQGARLSVDGYDGSLKRQQWRNYVAAQAKRLAESDQLEQDQAIFPLLAGGWLAARQGDTETAARVLRLVRDPVRARGDNSTLGMQAIVQAELALAASNPAAAIATLRSRHDGNELYFSHAVLMRAYAANREYPAALVEAQWLSKQRGRAYVEWNSWEMWTPANIVESNLALLSAAEFAEKLGRRELAQQYLKKFLEAWPSAARSFVAPRLEVLREALASRPV